MNQATQRDSGLHQFSQVEADVQDYLDAVYGGQAVEILHKSGTRVYGCQNSPQTAQVVCIGRGGGFCWDRQWPRSDLRSYLRSVIQHDPQLRRGPVSEVFPEEYR